MAPAGALWKIPCVMDLTFSPEEEAFRAEARAWLASHVPTRPLPSLDTAEGSSSEPGIRRTAGALFPVSRHQLVVLQSAAPC